MKATYWLRQVKGVFQSLIKKGSVEDGFKWIKLREGLSFQQVPNKNKDRSVLYITAPSGSGKSYYTKQYIQAYHKDYPKRDIYMFSSLESDVTLDSLKYLKRIKIKSPEFLTTELNSSDFVDSLVIMDDCDCITDKVVKKKVMGTLGLLLETGRHSATDVIVTSHVACSGHDTKRQLNECTSLTLFPLTMGARSLKYLLETSFGFDKKQIEELKNISGRSVTIFKTYPTIIMTTNEIWIRGHRGEN